MVTDPIADMLTRIRNAITAKHEEVCFSASKHSSSSITTLLKILHSITSYFLPSK